MSFATCTIRRVLWSFPSKKNGDGWLISSYDHIDMNNHSIDGWTFFEGIFHIINITAVNIGYGLMNNHTIS